MIKNLKKKFIVFTLLSVFALLVLLMGTVNLVNFATVSASADKVLDRIEDGKGMLLPVADVEYGKGVLSPDSPETSASVRYFTVKIVEDEASIVAFEISSVDPETAVKWATNELKNRKSGWTRTSYRYKTYKVEGNVYVSVIDYSREIGPSLTVLIGSLVALVLGVTICLVLLLLFYDRLIFSVTRVDSMQNDLISEIGKELKEPLNVIALENKSVKEKYGESDATRSIDKQMEILNDLAFRLGDLSFPGKNFFNKKKENVSAITNDVLIGFADDFRECGIKLVSDIAENVELVCNSDTIKKMLYEIVDNGLKYSASFFEISLSENDGRIKLIAKNDGDDLVDGDWDRVFERGYRASPKTEGKGMGLAIVKSVVDNHGGRAKVQVENGVFRLKIEL